jgi:large subunit ribosomal protein L32
MTSTTECTHPCTLKTRTTDVAVPKRKTSRSNTRHRRSQWKAAAPTLVTCARCREPKLAHTVCPTCGTYAKRRVLDV